MVGGLVSVPAAVGNLLTLTPSPRGLAPSVKIIGLNEMKIVIFDIDGTLADCEHRVHHVRKPTGEKKDWRAFFAGISDDSLIMQVASIYHMLASAGATIILLTGRDEKYRKATETWLAEHGLTAHTELMMKTVPFQPDDVQKKSAYEYISTKYGVPDAVFEDRPRVVKMWKDMGLFVFNVDQGDGNE